MGEVTEVAVATMDFFTAEVDAIHATCDSRYIDRFAPDGSVLSISQRVEALADQQRAVHLAARYLASLGR